MKYRLLGSFEVLADDGGPVRVGGGKRRALLALLLLHQNQVVRTDHLMEGLWGERRPASAAKALQVYVSQLRKELGGSSSRGRELVRTHPNGYAISAARDEIDITRFEDALAAGQRALVQADPARAAGTLRTALALWRGPALADFAYEPFAQQAIARLDELRLVALEARVDADLALGRHAEVIGDLQAAVCQDPLRERFRAQLMLALYRCGRQADALAAYRDASHEMREQLGLDPGPALRELEAKVLEHHPELDAPRSRRAPEELPIEPAAGKAPTGWRSASVLRRRRLVAAGVAAGVLAAGLGVAVSEAIGPVGGRRAATAPVPCTNIGAARFECRWYRPGDGISAGAAVVRDNRVVGYLHQGRNWVLCQQQGADVHNLAGDRNDWYAWTIADNHQAGWASPLDARGGDNYSPFEGAPNCNHAHGPAPSTSGLWDTAPPRARLPTPTTD